MLVNGSHTKEFEISQGLRQGDPILMFIFLMVAKGFNVLMELGRFLGFTFDGGAKQFSHLQYMYDILIINEKYLENISTIKTILILFEIMIGFKVNFHKSLLLGINISQQWLVEAKKNSKMKIRLPNIQLSWTADWC